LLKFLCTSFENNHLFVLDRGALEILVGRS
jgi:hypothetical protein